MKARWIPVAIGGALIGVIAIALWKLGNPLNMGFCTACFERDIAGALGLHSAHPVQLFRVEIAGVVLGAFVLALLRREFKPRAGSAPVLRFLAGAFMMIGALVFLGCPLRMWIRLGAGDLNALVGLAGLVVGAVGGSFIHKASFDPPKPVEQKGLEGYLFPALTAGILVLFLLQAGGVFTNLFKSAAEFNMKKGPGLLYPGSPKSGLGLGAGLAIAIGLGMAGGAIGQYTRFCTVGGIRDLILIRSGALLSAVLALAVVYGAGSAIFGSFKIGFEKQALAHTIHLWNFLGLALVGLVGVLIHGCPFRQLVKAGEGDSDAAFATLGLFAGAALAHNFKLAASPKAVPPGGKIMVIAGLVIIAAVGYFLWKRKGAAAAEGKLNSED